eukprot:3586408-Pyramimonas_sp.AAC.1
MHHLDGEQIRGKHIRSISTPPRNGPRTSLAVRFRNRSVDLSAIVLYVPPIGDASAKKRKALED